MYWIDFLQRQTELAFIIWCIIIVVKFKNNELIAEKGIVGNEIESFIGYNIVS